jgi:ATP-dependent helicase HrpA
VETADTLLADVGARLPALTIRDGQDLRRRADRARRDGDEASARAVLDALDEAEERAERRRARVPSPTYPEGLPVSERRDELVAAIRDNQVVIVAGETGSGKSTQLPKICLEAGRASGG